MKYPELVVDLGAPFENTYQEKDGTFICCNSCRDYNKASGNCFSHADHDYGWCGSRYGLPDWRPKERT